MALQCNIFKTASDTDCTNVVKLHTVLNAIKSDRYREAIELIRSLDQVKDKVRIKNLKFVLPSVTFSGVFDERVDAGIVHYNQLMIIDIDKLSYKKILALKKKLKLNPWVYSFFESPSRGLKILVFVDCDESQHIEAFNQLYDEFLQLYDVKIDKSGKNVSRLCFLSWDPELYINPEPFYFHVEENVRSGFTSLISYSSEVSESQVTDGRKILDLVVKMVTKSKTGSYHTGNRNNFVFVASCLMCEFGVYDELTINLIGNRFSSLEYKEVKTTVLSAYKKAKHNFGTKSMSGGSSSQGSLYN